MPFRLSIINFFDLYPLNEKIRFKYFRFNFKADFNECISIFLRPIALQTYGPTEFMSSRCSVESPTGLF